MTERWGAGGVEEGQHADGPLGIGHSSTATTDITSCGLGTAGADYDGSGMRAQPAATAAASQQARCECAVGMQQTRAKCPAARQTESATHSTSCTDMVSVASLIGAPSR